MWRRIDALQGSSYFSSCNISEFNVVTFCLWDGQQSWIEKIHLDDVKQKVKLLNRRFDFNENHIRTALTDGEVETVTLEEREQETTAIDAEEKLVLKFKYRVLGRPFNYTWSVKKQTLAEFQEVFVVPLFTALLGCHEQIKVLTDNMRKKDAEILQYRKEGAILSRKSLATSLFNFEEFSKKFETSNKIVEDFTQLGKFIIDAENKNKNQPPNSPQRKVENQKQDEERKTGEKLTSDSPRHRKRKFSKHQLLETTLKTRRQCFEYESSQSQSFSGSQSTEESNNDTAATSKSNNQTVKPRRASRCTPIKEKNENKSSEDTESDDLRSMSPRKRATRNLNLHLSQSDNSKSVNTDNTNKNVKNKDSSPSDETDQQGTTNKAKPSSCAVVVSSCENDDLMLASPRKRLSLNRLRFEEKEKGATEKDSITSNKTVENQDRNANKSLNSNNSKIGDANRSTSQNEMRKEINKEKNKEKLNAVGLEHTEDISLPLRKGTPVTLSKTTSHVVINKESIGKIKNNEDCRNNLTQNKDNDKNTSFDISDSENDEVIETTPRKRKPINTNMQSQGEDRNCLNNTNKRESSPKTREPTRQNLYVDETSNDVVEISTDSESGDRPLTPSRRRLRQRKTTAPESPSKSAFLLKSRITRSSPLVLTTPTKFSDGLEQIKKRRHSMNSDKPLALGEISSQLEAIRKELESLEALRLADLKHRTCKA